jgi:branched-chain amino acid transport system permease protein
MRSPWGRVLRAIREDEDAARALGKNTFKFKMQSLILGGLFGSIAGVLLAVSTANANPEDFNPTQTYWAWAALIIGGIAAPGGPIIGSMLFWGLAAFTEQVLQQAREAKLIDFLSGDQIGQLRYILVGLGLVLMMVLRPEGIFGNKKEMSLDAR